MISSLKVISRTSTAHLPSRPGNLRELGQHLGVANVLEGSVQREGNAVRVNVQLIKAETDEHLWAQIYDRKLDNIFAVQSEIAMDIAGALNATMTEEEKRWVALQSTAVPGAYEAYLRGVAALHERGGRSKAALFFQEAVKRDPDYALAWAHSAKLAAQTYSRRESTEAQRKIARAALDKAMRQPDLPEVQLAQGFYHYYVEKDYTRARRQFEEVLANWPNDAETFMALGSIARREGRWTESRSYYEQAVARDPMRRDGRSRLISVLVATRDLDAAVLEADQALARWPGDIGFVAEKARILQRMGRLAEAGVLLKPLRNRTDGFVYRRVVAQALYERKYSEAIGAIEAQLALEPDNYRTGALKVELGRLRALARDPKRATKDLEEGRALLAGEFLRQPRNVGVLNALALAYCYLGDRDKALTYVQRAMGLSPPPESRTADTQLRIWAYFGDRERAIAALERLLKMPGGDYTPAMLRLDPIFDKLRGDPRFKALAAEDAKPS
jgi:tetratricopeptide (TPR) repeat protein